MFSHLPGRMRLAIIGKAALSRSSRNPALYYEVLHAGDSDVLVGYLTKHGLVFMQLANVTNCQLYIAVQNVQETLAYTIHEFFVTIRDDSFMQFMLGCLEHLEGMIF